MLLCLQVFWRFKSFTQVSPPCDILSPPPPFPSLAASPEGCRSSAIAGSPMHVSQRLRGVRSCSRQLHTVNSSSQWLAVLTYNSVLNKTVDRSLQVRFKKKVLSPLFDGYKDRWNKDITLLELSYPYTFQALKLVVCGEIKIFRQVLMVMSNHVLLEVIPGHIARKSMEIYTRAHCWLFVSVVILASKWRTVMALSAAKRVFS